MTAFTVTSGVVQSSSLVEHPTMREETADTTPNSVLLTWAYLGATIDTAPLDGGEVRRQIGLKLRSANPCNLIYVMRELLPDSRVFVQMKLNPGCATSAECGANGYTTLASVPVASHSSGVLRASFGADGRLYVYDGGTQVAVVALPAGALALSGGYGVRSDNGRFFFSVAAE